VRPWPHAVPTRIEFGGALRRQIIHELGADARMGEDDRMSNTLAVTDANFEQEVEKHDGLTVVDFWATWCGPCRMIAPILDQLAKEYEGKVKITKLDVDQNIRTASRFNVRSIPMLLFFKGGKVVDQIIGAVPKTQIESKFQQHAA
jgi:thioredoxin 1